MERCGDVDHNTVVEVLTTKQIIKTTRVDKKKTFLSTSQTLKMSTPLNFLKITRQNNTVENYCSAFFFSFLDLNTHSYCSTAGIWVRFPPLQIPLTIFASVLITDVPYPVIITSLSLFGKYGVVEKYTGQIGAQIKADYVGLEPTEWHMPS